MLRHAALGDALLFIHRSSGELIAQALLFDFWVEPARAWRVVEARHQSLPPELPPTELLPPPSDEL